MLRPLIVQGMHGAGDNLHQRAVIRELMRDHEVWLETSWPCLYWDMPELKLVGRGTRLRTQLKNAAREQDRFTRQAPPRGSRSVMIWYRPADVRNCGSVLKAMMKSAGVTNADFRLPVREDWLSRADELLAKLAPTKPVMFFRPLVERAEWTGCATRNPDHRAWSELYAAIRDRFYVISIADVVPKVEWLAGPKLDADAEFHAGELDFELLIGLAKRSALIFSSPGFAVVLGQAVGTPGVTVFGGYEDARSFSSGAAYAPWLAIEPIKPCPCFTHGHGCNKTIDMDKSKERLLSFIDELKG